MVGAAARTTTAFSSGCSTEVYATATIVHVMQQAARFAALVLLCAAATATLADERTVYRSELRDGRVVYGDAPVPGARQSLRIQIERHAGNPQQEEAAQRALTLSRQQILRDADARSARLRQLDNEASDSYEAVRKAQQELESGSTVREGDRQGRRLLPSYWDRQRRLQLQLRAEQQRLESILEQRSALQY